MLPIKRSFPIYFSLHFYRKCTFICSWHKGIRYKYQLWNGWEIYFDRSLKFEATDFSLSEFVVGSEPGVTDQVGSIENRRWYIGLDLLLFAPVDEFFISLLTSLIGYGCWNCMRPESITDLDGFGSALLIGVIVQWYKKGIVWCMRGNNQDQL